MTETTATQAISKAVADILFGVQYSIDAFCSAVAANGGQARLVNRIADANAVPDGHSLALGEGPGWRCRLVQVGSSAEARLDAA
jgi:hypothetical protein